LLLRVGKFLYIRIFQVLAYYDTDYASSKNTLFT
jgi:hypothetical protein